MYEGTAGGRSVCAVLTTEKEHNNLVPSITLGKNNDGGRTRKGRNDEEEEGGGGAEWRRLSIRSVERIRATKPPRHRSAKKQPTDVVMARFGWPLESLLYFVVTGPCPSPYDMWLGSNNNGGSGGRW